MRSFFIAGVVARSIGVTLVPVQVYVSSSNSGTITEYGTTGSEITSFSVGTGAPGMAVSSAGNVYVAHQNLN